MRFTAFLSDERGQAAYEYSLVFLIFAVAAIAAMYGVQSQSSGALVNTRARMVCNSVTLRSDVAASVDSAGNISCR